MWRAALLLLSTFGLQVPVALLLPGDAQAQTRAIVEDAVYQALREHERIDVIVILEAPPSAKRKRSPS